MKMTKLVLLPLFALITVFAFVFALDAKTVKAEQTETDYTAVTNWWGDGTYTDNVLTVTNNSVTAETYTQNHFVFEFKVTSLQEGDSYVAFFIRGGEEGNPRPWAVPTGASTIRLHPANTNIFVEGEHKGYFLTNDEKWHPVEINIDNDKKKVTYVLDKGLATEASFVSAVDNLGANGRLCVFVSLANVQLRNIKTNDVTSSEPVSDATGITLPETIKMEAGSSKVLYYALVPESADDEVTVTVSDEEVLGYEGGKLIAKKAGTATVTVTSVKNENVKAQTTVEVVPISEKPENMPKYEDYMKLSYELGCDPSVADSLTVTDTGYILENANSYPTFFPIKDSVPDASFSMNAMSFALKVETELAGDWCGAILFRTATPGTVFFSNASGIEIRLFKNSPAIVVLHHGGIGEDNSTVLGTTAASLADGLTHYYNFEVSGNEITVCIDGANVVDAFDATEQFGRYYNVENNNSFNITARNGKMTVTDLCIYDTTAEEPEPDDSSSGTTEPDDSSDTTSDASSGEPSDTSSDTEEGCFSGIIGGNILLISALFVSGALIKKKKNN